jgi:hypothetical protein
MSGNERDVEDSMNGIRNMAADGPAGPAAPPAAP